MYRIAGTTSNKLWFQSHPSPHKNPFNPISRLGNGSFLRINGQLYYQEADFVTYGD